MEIKVGDRFLSHGKTGTVISTTIENSTYTVLWISDDKKTYATFSPNGKFQGHMDDELRDLQPIPAIKVAIPENEDFEIASLEMREECLRLQKAGRIFSCDGVVRMCDFTSAKSKYRMLPVVIQEGVEFSGEQYRSEFERLVKAWREFEVYHNGEFREFDGEFFDTNTYVLLPVPQHTDANGNVLKVGDRVECLGFRETITGFAGGVAQFAAGIPWPAKDCRLLTTRKRPLCVHDFDKAPFPMLKMDDGKASRVHADWDHKGVYPHAGGELCIWLDLQESGHQWRPSAGEPWQPCEVTEEVLV